MVTVTDFKERMNTKGEKFYALIIQGDLDVVQSSTGNYYATAKKASITSTFDENVCKALIGKQIAGKIDKVSCEEYEYVVPETGEVIMLAFRYSYVPDVPMQTIQETPVPFTFGINNMTSQRYVA